MKCRILCKKVTLKNIIPLKSYLTFTTFINGFYNLSPLDGRNKKVVPLDVPSNPTKFCTIFLEHSVQSNFIKTGLVIFDYEGVGQQFTKRLADMESKTFEM